MNMAFDSGRQITVMFGGRDPFLTTVYSDTYEYALTAWNKVLTPHSPPARFWAGMAYDAHRQRMVLFGGLNSSGSNQTAFGDTWEYNGSDWTNISTAHSPAAQSGLSMTFDSCRRKTVLFGVRGDTWEYDGADWTKVITSSAPPARNLAAMVFDPGRCRSILFGGLPPMGPGLADTWEYDGGNWTQINTAISPPGRWGHVMAFDTNRARTVLFGGYGPSYPTGGETNDTWEYDGATWVQEFPAQSPLPSEQRGMAYDSTRARAVTFGGFGEPNDAWEYIGLNPNCIYSLGSAGQSFSASGGLGSFTVSTGPTCGWSPISSASWIMILPSRVVGAGTVSYAVAANQGGPRNGSISVGGQTYNISQQALSCTYSIAPPAAAFTATGGTARVAVSAPAGCAWTATSNAGWMTVTSGASGTGTGAVVIQASANTGAQRSGTVTVAGQSFSATQAAPGASACGALDVTSQVSVPPGGFTPIFPAGSNLWHQEITITNRGPAISGPINYVLIGLPTPSGVGLTGGFGETTCFGAAAYIVPVSSGGLASAAHVTFGLDFVDQFGLPSYTPKVLSGQPSR